MTHKCKKCLLRLLGSCGKPCERPRHYKFAYKFNNTANLKIFYSYGKSNL
nr:MAG TPA: hypothetical protein [Microviridae sp.]